METNLWLHLTQDSLTSLPCRLSQSQFSISSQALSQSACLYIQTLRPLEVFGQFALAENLQSSWVNTPLWSELESGGIAVHEFINNGLETKTRSIVEVTPLLWWTCVGSVTTWFRAYMSVIWISLFNNGWDKFVKSMLKSPKRMKLETGTHSYFLNKNTGLLKVLGMN